MHFGNNDFKEKMKNVLSITLYQKKKYLIKTRQNQTTTITSCLNELMMRTKKFFSETQQAKFKLCLRNELRKR